MAKKTKELLYDYSQLFDILELDLLPGEERDHSDETIGKAVVEYYNYLLDFSWEYFDSPEMERGCGALRRLLRDLGKANWTSMDKVWKVAAKLDDNLTLLKFSQPHIEWMWN